MKKTVSIISILLVITIGLFTYLKLKKPEKPSDCIETTGLVEATEVGLGPKIAGRIDWLCCKEGDAVKAGELAVRLDDKELKARVLQGRKSLKAEEASLNI
ncbi:MAG: HlyD family secretion protein, partial [Deltaproteobacteria bacterium]